MTKWRCLNFLLIMTLLWQRQFNYFYLCMIIPEEYHKHRLKPSSVYTHIFQYMHRQILQYVYKSTKCVNSWPTSYMIRSAVGNWLYIILQKLNYFPSMEWPVKYSHEYTDTYVYMHFSSLYFPIFLLLINFSFFCAFLVHI